MHRDSMPGAQVGRHCGKRQQLRAFQREALQRLGAGGAVDARPRDLEHPLACLGVEVGHVAEGARGQEVALHVLHAGLDDALLLRIGRRARRNAKAVALGALGVGALHLGVAGAGPGDCALGVVDDDPGEDPVERLEGVAVAGEPGLDRLVADELDVLVAAPRQSHDEEPGLEARPGHHVGHHRAGAEVDLGGFARFEIEATGRRRRGARVDRLQQAPDRGVAPRVAVVPDQGGVNRRPGNAGLHPDGDPLAVIGQTRYAARR